jgi:hypothetical protein
MLIFWVKQSTLLFSLPPITSLIKRNRRLDISRSAS